MSYEIKIKIDPEKQDYSVDFPEDIPGHPELYKLLGKMAYIHTIKNMDYGGGDPLGNFKLSAKWTGIPAWKGALIRMTDKWARLSSLLKRQNQTGYVDESFEDTLIDNAVYSLLIIALRKENDDISAPKPDGPTPYDTNPVSL